MKLRHQFVSYIPEVLEEGVLYVSLDFDTVVHRCACGCGEEVVTPLGPGEWKLTYDRTVSLAPSVGNWSFACRSHYWIEGSRVRWARTFSRDEIGLVRRKARARRDGYYSPEEGASRRGSEDGDDMASGTREQRGIVERVCVRLAGLLNSIRVRKE